MDARDASAAEMRRLFSDPDPLALDEETVERLLAGDLPPAQVPPAYAEVAAVLAAAVAGPTAGELAGQGVVLAGLRAVTGSRPGAPGRGRPVRRRRVGLVAVVLVGALGTGGVAAAAGGQLLGPVRSILGRVGGGGEPAMVGQPGRPPVGSSPASAGPAGSRSGGVAGSGSGGVAVTGAARDGLCRAVLAGRGGDRGARLDAAALRALAELAGGAGKVPGWCAAVLGGQAEPKEKDAEPQGPPGGQGQGQGGPPTSTGNPEPRRAPGSPGTRSHGG